MTPDPQPSAEIHAGVRSAADLLDRRIGAALAAAPLIAISENFASRVALTAAAEASAPPVALPRLRYARGVTLACTTALLLRLAAKSPGLLTHDASKATAFLWLLSAEAVLVAAALGPWNELWSSAD